MRFVLSFDCDNAAFAGDPRPEIARLLQQAAGEVARSRMSGKLFDINGNHVGDFDTETPPAGEEGRERVECGDCRWTGIADECAPVRHLSQRVRAGEPVPAGECPECGALCHAVD